MQQDQDQNQDQDDLFGIPEDTAPKPKPQPKAKATATTPKPDADETAAEKKTSPRKGSLQAVEWSDELRALGATNALQARRHSLTGKGRFAAATAAYETLRREDGKLPSTWEVIYAHAWAPPPGAPIRGPSEEVASVPVSAIPIRRRGD